MVEITSDAIRINLVREVDDSYDIVFGINLFPQIAKELKESQLGSRYAIITDSNVEEFYGYSLGNALVNEGLDVKSFSFKAGEQSKDIETCMNIIGRMSELKYGRDSAILALGGGVVGDMAGFIAAIFNRGIPYIQIPTTIVAQADSSIGGKTAVDTKYGKNLVGAFKQPKKVYIDAATVLTLTEMEYKNGLAETVKHGIIQDKSFFNYLQENADSILERSIDSSLYIAKQNCRIKGSVVEQDPHEKGLRRILNYGHTVGHALEKLTDYKLLHGEAVSIGMMVAGRIANALGYFSDSELKQQEQLLLKMGLPTAVPEEISDEAIIEVTSVDKKAKDGRARYVLPVSIGRMHEFDGAYAIHIDTDVVEKAIQQTRI